MQTASKRAKVSDREATKARQEQTTAAQLDYLATDTSLVSVDSQQKVQALHKKCKMLALKGGGGYPSFATIGSFLFVIAGIL